jgi:DNA modification methylase
MTPKDLEQRPIADLTPYARNSRTHSEAQVAQIAASITEFGFTNPVLVDAEGGIIAGHGRVLAAQSLGLETVPVLVLDHLSEDQRRAYVIADNKLALNAGWDDDALRSEIEELARGGYGLDVIGFDADELEALLNPPSTSQADPDEVPEPPAIPVTRPGDVWMMDKHRIICGDSTDAETVAALLQGAKPHLMVTDPPYGVEYDADWRNSAKRADGSAIGGRAVGKVENDDRADWQEAWDLFPGDVAYVWHAGLYCDVVKVSLEAAKLECRAQLIWVKSNFAVGRAHYHFQHEPLWYAVRRGGKSHFNGDRKQSSAWFIDKPRSSETGHSTQKPIECMKRPIENNSKPGDAVYEPFSGSGTTIIAAEMTGRRCFAIELSPAYVDVAVRRWEDFAGRVATLEATGQSFREVADERRALAA